MALLNGPESFGLVTRVLHWVTAAGVLAQAALGLRIARGEITLADVWLFSLHKSLGLALLLLVLLRLAWHRVSPPPPPLPAGPVADGLARAVHRGLYALLLALPVAGWVASSASGIDTVVFGALTLPPIAPVSAAWEAAGFAAHRALALLLAALVLLHIAGALRRAAAGDGTLRRMVTGRAPR